MPTRYDHAVSVEASWPGIWAALALIAFRSLVKSLQLDVPSPKLTIAIRSAGARRSMNRVTAGSIGRIVPALMLASSTAMTTSPLPAAAALE